MTRTVSRPPPPGLLEYKIAKHRAYPVTPPTYPDRLRTSFRELRGSPCGHGGSFPLHCSHRKIAMVYHDPLSTSVTPTQRLRLVLDESGRLHQDGVVDVG
jgi:hypothetical protein